MNETHRLPLWLRRWLAQRLAPPVPLADRARARHACLYKVDRIGDFVLATGALRLLVGHFGATNCRLVVSADAAPFAAAEFPDVDRWIAPAHTSGVWRELRPLRAQLAPIWAQESFDALVCLRHARSLHRDVTLSWLHAKNWHGLGPRPTMHDLALNNRPALPPEFPTAATAPWCRELAAHRMVVGRVIGREVSWDEIRPRLSHPRGEKGREIVLCPFGGERIRDYPRAGWLATWRAAFSTATEVRVLGPATRRSDLETLAAELRTAGANTVVETDAPPLEFVQRIARARLVLTVESAAAHLAAALDQRAIVITGGGHFGWFAPWGASARQRWLNHPLECYGCNWQCSRARVECLEDLPPAAVASAIKEVLAHE